ncbi:hypothetical protein D9M72_466220 [compost metagenome]
MDTAVLNQRAIDPRKANAVVIGSGNIDVVDRHVRCIGRRDTGETAADRKRRDRAAAGHGDHVLGRIVAGDRRGRAVIDEGGRRAASCAAHGKRTAAAQKRLAALKGQRPVEAEVAVGQDQCIGACRSDQRVDGGSIAGSRGHSDDSAGVAVAVGELCRLDVAGGAGMGADPGRPFDTLRHWVEGVAGRTGRSERNAQPGHDGALELVLVVIGARDAERNRRAVGEPG